MPERSKELNRYYSKRFRERHPEYHRDAQRKRRAAKGDHINALRRLAHRANPERVMLDAAKRTAKKKNLPFNITLQDLAMPVHCPVFGFTLTVGDGKRTDSSPSIDRIVPERGYVRGNIIIVSWRANRLKSDSSPCELLKIGKFYAEYMAAQSVGAV